MPALPRAQQSFFGAKAALEQLLGRSVDLVEPDAVRNPYVLAIQTFTAGMDAKACVGNAMAQAAVERKFEVIGETLNQLAKLDETMAKRIPELRQIVAFRNQLIHS